MKFIILYRLLTILLLLSFQAQGQTHWLKGVLLNKNTTTIVPEALLFNAVDSATTHADGQFIIKMKPDDTLLHITHPLYKTTIAHPDPQQRFMTLFIQPYNNIEKEIYSDKRTKVDSTSPFISRAIKAYLDETYKKAEENPFIKTVQIPYSGFTLNSSHASYNNIRRFIDQNNKVPPASVRIAEMLNYFSFNDSLPVAYPDHPLHAFANLSTCPWHTGHWLMRVAVQSDKKTDSLHRPANIVLLIDVSGSMSKPDKLPLLKIAFRQLIQQLTFKDTLAVVVYTNKAKVVLPPTPGTRKEKMLETIDHLYAGGSTAGSTGIEKAFQLAKKHFIPKGNNRVILATDGDFNVGKTSDQEMKSIITRYRHWGISITCIGVGTGNYKDSKLETLAHWGQGTFAYLDNKEEALRLFDKHYNQKMFITASDVTIKTVFNPNQVQAFRLIGYDSGGSSAKLSFTDHFHIPGEEIGASERMTAYYELIPNKDQVLKDFPLATLILQYTGFQDQKKYMQTYPVAAQVSVFKEKNADWRFGASVVLFGMLLQQSEYTGTGNYSLSEKIARHAKEALSEHEYKGYMKLLRQGKKQNRKQ